MKRFLIFASIILLMAVPYNLFAQFQQGPAMNLARMAHYQVLLDDGSIWVVGGHGTGFVALNSAEIYDINSGTFTLQNMQYYHDNGALVKLNDGRFLIAGGATDLGGAPGYNTAEIYDPANGTYTQTGNMTYERSNCYGVTLASGQVLIAGGWYNTNSLTYTEIYDPATGSFVSNPALVTPRAYPMMFPTADGGAVLFGGYEGYSANPFYQSVEYFDSTTSTFTTLYDNILPGEDGYYIAAIKNVTDAFKTNNGNYIFPAYRRNDTDTQYVFIKFDPETKVFSSVYRENVPASDPFYLIGSVLNKNANVLYCLWELATDPLQIGIGYLDLNTVQMIMPAEWHELSPDYYPGYIGLSMLDDNTIMMTGGYSTPGGNTNFTPLDSTMFITLNVTDVKNESNSVVDNWELSQNYPNPFNPSTKIKFEIPKQVGNDNSFVTLRVYDVLGNEVATLLDEEKPAGTYEVTFNAANLPSGIYVYRLSAGSYAKTRKMILLK